MKKYISVFILSSFPFLSLHAFVANQSADVVVGHSLANYGDANANDPKQNSLSSPRNAIVSGSKLFVADGNNRVLIYNSIPTSDNVSADVVVGQPDFISNKINQGAAQPAANTLWTPRGLLVYNGKLIVADSSNNRVLIFNSIPTSNNASADVVIGQLSMSTGAVNQQGLEPVVSSNTLSSPHGIFVDSNGKLYVADNGNSRVLIYNTIPTTNNVSADVVLGQPNFSTNAVNQQGIEPVVSSNTLSAPTDVLVVSNKLFVSDFSNNRVLVYVPVPTVNNSSATYVVGQSSFTGKSANQGTNSASSNTLRTPFNLGSDGSNLLISDLSNGRVLIYAALPSTSNVSADYTIGQSSMSGLLSNQGGAVAANTINNPEGLYISGGKLFVSDFGNHRVLIYNSVPTSNGVSANNVIGQSDMLSANANQKGPNASSLNTPHGVSSDGTKFFLVDTSNNRILIYNSIPSAIGASADVVLGQLTSTTTVGDVSSTTLDNPYSVYVASNKLFVADQKNSRILIYDPIPTVSASSASVVVGQPNFTTRTTGSTSAKLNLPRGVFASSTKLYVADTSNHRIQVYDRISGPWVNVTTTTFGTGTAGSTEVTLNVPEAVFGLGNKLFVADTGNHRVLIYTSTSSTQMPDGTVAVSTVVVGQTAFGAGNDTAGTQPNALRSPTGVWSDGTKLWIADAGNNRVLQFNAIPTSNGVSADVMFGQRTMTSSTTNSGALSYYGTSANSLSGPGAVFGISGKLFVADTNNHRVLAFNDPGTATAPTSTASNLSGQVLGISSITWTWTPLSNAFHKVAASTGGAISNILVANTTFYNEVNLATNTAYARSILTSFTTDFVLTSTSSSVTKYTLAADPASLVVSSVTSSSLTLTWDGNTNPSTTRFVVQQSTSSVFNPTSISTPVAYGSALTATTTAFANLLPGTTVAFRLAAYNGDGVASLGFSNTVSTVTLVPAGYGNNVAVTAVSSVTASTPAGRDSRTFVAISPNTSLPNTASAGSIAISTNPSDTPLVVSTAIIVTANANVGSGSYLVTGSPREFAFYDQGGVRQSGTFGSTLMLFMPYADANNDGFVDTNTSLPEKKLKIFKLNETTQRWEEVGGTVDTVGKTVFVQIRSFSVYALLAPLAASNLGDVKVYPTPWQRGAGNKFDAASLTFDNLTSQAKIQIYTILGELVFEQETSGTDGKVTWNGKNMKSETVASGVYIWRITNNQGQSKQGRLAIER